MTATPRQAPMPPCPHCGQTLNLNPLAPTRARVFGTITAPTRCCGLLVSLEPYLGLDVRPVTADGEYMEPSSVHQANVDRDTDHQAEGSAFTQVGAMIGRITALWPEVVRERAEQLARELDRIEGPSEEEVREQIRDTLSRQAMKDAGVVTSQTED